MTKAEKKRICSLMDVKKLSAEASLHAAQNECLPLRVVVQVLFFEQLRAATNALAAPTTEPSHNSSRSTAEVGAEWDQRQAPDNPNSLKIQPGSSKIEDEGRKITDQQKKNRNSIKERGGGLLLPSRSRRIFDKIWLGKGQGENSKSSETSGSSQSPPPSAKPRDGKSSGASSRNRRHSVS